MIGWVMRKLRRWLGVVPHGHIMVPGGRLLPVIGVLPVTLDGYVYGILAPRIYTIVDGEVVNAVEHPDVAEEWQPVVSGVEAWECWAVKANADAELVRRKERGEA